MSTPTIERPRVDPADDLDTSLDDAPDRDEERVHHHARIDHDGALVGDGAIFTLCGMRLPHPRPEAASWPCCPGCARRMGGPCR